MIQYIKHLYTVSLFVLMVPVIWGQDTVTEFMPVSAGDFILEISDEATFRDYNNVEISINEIVNGRVVVTP